MDVKPVAWVPLFEIERGKRPSEWNLQDLWGRHDVPLYDQSAIDALTSEIERLNKLERMRFIGSEKLANRAESAEAEAARLREQLK